MDVSLKDDKRAAASRYSRLSFIFGIISLTGLICCFPFMPVIGGMGIVFAIISRGGANVFSPEARKGLIFSIIGTVSALVLTVVVMGGSVWYTMDQLKKDPAMINEIREQYEQMYNSVGRDVPDELLETLDRMEEYSEQLRNSQ